MEESWRRHRGEGTMEGEPWRMHHGGVIIEEAARGRQQGEASSQEAQKTPKKHKEAPRRPREAARRHPGLCLHQLRFLHYGEYSYMYIFIYPPTSPRASSV